MLTPKQGSLTRIHCKILETAEVIVYTLEKSILDAGQNRGFYSTPSLEMQPFFIRGQAPAGTRTLSALLCEMKDGKSPENV